MTASSTPPSSAPASAPTLQETQELLGEAMRKMFGQGAQGIAGMDGIEHKLQLIKQMGETMQVLQKMLDALGVKSTAPAAPATPANTSLGGEVGEVVGEKMSEAFVGNPFAKALGDLLGRTVGEKLTLALGSEHKDSLLSQFAESLKALVNEQKGHRSAMAKLLSDTSEKLQTLLGRPQGSEPMETARKLGEILGEASQKMQELTSKNPVQKLSETIMTTLDAVQKRQGT